MGIDLADRRVTSYRDAVAAELRAALARRGLSGSALARMTGRTQTWISARTRGARPIDMDDLELIAGALRVDPVELLPRNWVKPSPVPPTGGDAAWAPRGSNPQPADYKFASRRQVVTRGSEIAIPRPLVPRRRPSVPFEPRNAVPVSDRTFVFSGNTVAEKVPA